MDALLQKDIQYIKGVGPNRAELFHKLGLFCLQDIITYYPRTYEDRNKPKQIAYLEEGEEVLIEGIVCSKMTEIRTRSKKMTLYKLIVRDETAPCTLVWFNQSYLKNRFRVGQTYRFFGKVKRVNGNFEMQSPVFDVEGKQKNTGRIIPIYPSTYQLSQNVIRQVIENSLELVSDKIEETLPEYLLEEYHLLNKKDAIGGIHFPKDFHVFQQARKRLVFEELLGMQLSLLSLKNTYDKQDKGIAFSKQVLMSDIINTLPFQLTKAQLRVLEEIDQNMEETKPMNRLLQGDVGSGKTVISILAAYKAVKSGYQVAIMAPTAILASQHIESFKNLLERHHIRCELLISSIAKKKKEKI